MEIEELIRQLKIAFEAAELASDVGNKDEATDHLRFAKDLLDEQFLAE